MFLARTSGAFRKPPYPAPKLFWAIVGTQIFEVFTCGSAWGVPALRWSLIGLVWVYTCMDDSWHYYDANLDIRRYSELPEIFSDEE